MKTKLVVALLAVIATCAAVLAWNRKSPEAVLAKTNARHTYVSGNVQPSLREVKIRTQMNGKIREIRVNEGDRVERGQIIAILENSDSTARVSRAEAQLTQRESQFVRLRGDSAPAAMTEDLRKAKADVEQARAEMADARAELLKTFIRSPISGVLLRQKAKPGENISTDNPDGWIVAIQAGLSD